VLGAIRRLTIFECSEDRARIDGGMSDSKEPVPDPPPVRLTFDEVFAHGIGFVRGMIRQFGVRAADQPDAVQDVLAVVARRLPTYEHRGHLLAWLAAIVFRIANVYLRRQARQEAHTDRETEPATLPTEPQVSAHPQEDRAATNEVVRAILEAMRAERREVLELHHVDGMATKQIAAKLGIPLGTANTWLRLGQEEFRAAWRRHEAQMRHETRSRAVLPLFDPLDLLERLRPHAAAGGSGSAPLAWATAFVALAASLLVGVPTAPARSLAACDVAPRPTTCAAIPPAVAAPPRNVLAEPDLIGRASRALDAGRFAEALDILAEHAARTRAAGDHPTADVEAMRLTALIGAGRRDEAREPLASFAHRYPKDRRLGGLRAALGVTP
jgi:RNA polymerase sigma factor (sigma-70 family)